MKNQNLSNKLPNGHLFDIASDELNEILWFDQEFIKVLNTISKGADGRELRTECEDHAIQIDTQMDRLREISKVTGTKCRLRRRKL